MANKYWALTDELAPVGDHIPTVWLEKVTWVYLATDYDALAAELAECRKNNFDAAVLILEKRALEAALGKAVDTFEDIATVSRLLGKPLVAESARIASVHCRQALATAETICEQPTKGD